MFISYWEDKEPEFIKYYRKEYSDRAGMVLARYALKTINLKEMHGYKI